MNRCASITEGTDGFPGAAGRLPAECATIGQVLQDNGYSTFWLGKNHNVPTEDISSGGSRSEWPLQKGFDRFYGFLGGETNNWYPDLVEDNQFITQPATPEDGYHLSKDLADQALRMLRDQTIGEPDQAVVHVVLSRRQPRAAPQPEGVRRQIQGKIRRRLRGVS